jgi:hypothetical protein
MRVAVCLPERHDWPAMLAAARAVEAAGFDRVLLPDHLAYGSPKLEAWTAMAALAASTTRVGLGFSVLGATFRLPGLLAKWQTRSTTLRAGDLRSDSGRDSTRRNTLASASRTCGSASLAPGLEVGTSLEPGTR